MVISISIGLPILDKIPFLDITIALYRLYKKEKEKKFFNQLQNLLDKGYNNGKKLVDILLYGYIDKYKKKFLKETPKSIVYSSLRLALTAYGVEFNKTHQTKFGKTKVKDGKESFQVNEKMQQEFCDEMNEYFRFILKDNVINKLLENKNSEEFSERYLTLRNEIKASTPEQFVKWLFPEREDLLNEFNKKYKPCVVCGNLCSLRAPFCPKCGDPFS